MDSTYTFTVGNSQVIEAAVHIVGENGGIITDETTGLQMTVPEGALTDSIEIVLGIIDGIPLLPDTVQSIGQVYYFGPHGLQFLEDVTGQAQGNIPLLIVVKKFDETTSLKIYKVLKFTP